MTSPLRRRWAIALTLMAAVILFASTSVQVHVITAAQDPQVREAAFARARERASRIRNVLRGMAVLVLLPATWLWWIELGGRRRQGAA